MSDGEAVTVRHITFIFSPLSRGAITRRNAGFIHVLLQRAWPVNLTAHDSCCNTINQMAESLMQGQQQMSEERAENKRKLRVCDLCARVLSFLFECK